MIEITKPGKTIRYEFVCNKCGCEYIADLTDINQLYKEHTCNCPNCGTMNFGTEIKYEEELEK